jgi:hypothetical protein
MAGIIIGVNIDSCDTRRLCNIEVTIAKCCIGTRQPLSIHQYDPLPSGQMKLVEFNISNRTLKMNRNVS